MQMDQMRIYNMNATDYRFRNISLTLPQQNVIDSAYSTFKANFFKFTNFLTSLLGTSSTTINYESNNIYLSIFKVVPGFNFSNHFSNRSSNYQPFMDMNDCLNEIQINRLNNPYYSSWVTYVHWKVNPVSYVDKLYLNTTAPFHEMVVVDAVTNKEILISNCSKPIKHYFPVTTYTHLGYINNFRSLFYPNNDYPSDSPIYTSPIYVYENGTITNNTVQDRIKLYNRIWNFSCSFYDPTYKTLNTSGMAYVNFSSNYIGCSSDHLTGFTVNFVPNNRSFNIDGRFFYVKNSQVFTLMV